ncbi:response regulator transcription factor [Empedobacter stercoris]|uniref:Response regulator transcription factor n=1 Tax=Empedobacter falsenii TaxID=343874 RepID=A0ABY8V5C6_9FLAO|nr:MULTISPECIES: response regulator transcription factor [Empedobacter]MDM1522957.1 response regulator transcription factor [Empedobacter sp. 225-1]MDM1542977.1 response regulator transcription factor [Empedobacter sp. 189-2]UWX66696.1 response regulator transcription factor [Empedobacter stercoris]WIH96875.1 response regulator transcription factor [Empedobacter falsenii]HJD86589.1 response regulator transcription factor [Empedobacter falsenii]
MKTKIILVEDDQDLGTVLKQYLEFSDFEVIWFNHPQKLLNDLSIVSSAQLIILDVMLPEIDGFSLAKELVKTISIPYLFLTAKAQSFDRVLGLKLGADDYITKPCDPEELVLRIKNILRRNYPISEEIFLIGTYVFNRNQLTLSFKDEFFQLTEKETELLFYFIRNNQKLVTRKEILETIWGENDYFMGRSLDVFMTRLRKYFQNDETIKFESVRGIGFKIELPLK